MKRQDRLIWERNRRGQRRLPALRGTLDGYHGLSDQRRIKTASKKPADLAVAGFPVVVEVRRLELLTPYMRSKCGATILPTPVKANINHRILDRPANAPWLLFPYLSSRRLDQKKKRHSLWQTTQESLGQP